MILKENYSLSNYNTFKINVKAKKFVEIKSIDELKIVVENYSEEKILFLGGGSNVLFTEDYDSLVVYLNLKGKSLKEIDSDFSEVTANAGENWNELVNYCLENNLGGIENLSLIPGNVGSAPIQNIGAYGRELKDVFISCEVFDLENFSFKTYYLEDCQFEYRNSIFKNHKNLIVVSISLRLSNHNHVINSSYGGIEKELENKGIDKPTIQDISKVVCQIRKRKLPDPEKIGNAGSFFKNPVVNMKKMESIKKKFYDIPHFKISDTEYKIPAAWLIEKAGLKGKVFGKIGIHKTQPLVLVNYGGGHGKDLLKLSISIKEIISKIFNIDLETEVNII